MHDTLENVVVRLDQCRQEDLTWLWPRRIALGKLTLIDGDPAQGKSLLTLDLAARVSRGLPFPDGHPAPEACGVLLIGAEDGLQDTILPRLCAARADLSRVRLWQGHRRHGLCRPPVFPQDCESLRETIENNQARLIVIDPFLAFLSTTACSVNDQMVRQALTPLAQVAEATRSAMVLIRHLTKGGQGRGAIYRGTGAISIIGAARTAFLVGADPDQRRHQVLACTKTNLSDRPPSLGFYVRIDDRGRPYLEWTGVVDRGADDLLRLRGKRPGDTSKPPSADYLLEWLTDGPQSRERLYCKARSHGIGERTLHRAKAWLNVVSRAIHHEGRKIWYWHLPDDNRPFDPQSDYARFMAEFWEVDAAEPENAIPEQLGRNEQGPD
jgi:hypothetical protein